VTDNAKLGAKMPLLQKFESKTKILKTHVFCWKYFNCLSKTVTFCPHYFIVVAKNGYNHKRTYYNALCIGIATI